MNRQIPLLLKNLAAFLLAVFLVAWDEKVQSQEDPKSEKIGKTRQERLMEVLECDPVGEINWNKYNSYCPNYKNVLREKIDSWAFGNKKEEILYLPENFEPSFYLVRNFEPNYQMERVLSFSRMGVKRADFLPWLRLSGGESLADIRVFMVDNVRKAAWVFERKMPIGGDKYNWHQKLVSQYFNEIEQNPDNTCLLFSQYQDTTILKTLVIMEVSEESKKQKSFSPEEIACSNKAVAFHSGFRFIDSAPLEEVLFKIEMPTVPSIDGTFSPPPIFFDSLRILTQSKSLVGASMSEFWERNRGFVE